MVAKILKWSGLGNLLKMYNNIHLFIISFTYNVSKVGERRRRWPESSPFTYNSTRILAWKRM